MENQKVKDVKSLYSILTSVAEVYSPIQDMKAISMFPAWWRRVSFSGYRL